MLSAYYKDNQKIDINEIIIYSPYCNSLLET